MVSLIFDHVGTNPTSEYSALTSDLFIRKAIALTSDHVGTNPTVTSEWLALTSDLLVRKEVALTFDHVGTNPTVTSEWPTLTSDMERSNPLTITEWKQPLYLIKWEHIPQSPQNGHALTFDHVRLHLTIVS